MSKTGEQLKKRVLSWLSEHGYPLEMRVARSLALKKFGVTQSHYFKDYETGTAREIDVVGRLYSFVEPEVDIAIAELETFVVVECKSSDKPWIVFCETKSHTWNIQQASCNASAERLLNHARAKIQETELYGRSTKAGHGVAQAFGGNNDVPYAAVMSALKAAEAQAAEGRETEVRIANDPGLAHVSESSATIPVVVITSPLFECNLNDEGEPELTEVTHASIAFRYPNGNSRLRAGSTVHIVTEAGWSEFEDALLEFHRAAESRLAVMIPKPRNGA